MRTTLTSFSLTILILLTISSLANAETVPIPNHDAAIGLDGGPAGGASGVCSIIYYNWCSGWTWLYSGFTQSDQVGVIYDLAESCGGGSGHTCTNIGNWWYWRFTQGGYGGNGLGVVNYQLYEVDANDCLTGSPIGAFAGQNPVERWNYVPGLGAATGDRVALVTSWDKGTLPYAATDNNVANSAGGPACSGIGVGNGTSYQFRQLGVDLCPPAPFADALGPVDLIAISTWDCPSTTATETSSWSDLKVLFQ